MYSALSLVSKAGSARTSAGLQPAASPTWKPMHALQSRSCTRVVCSAGSESTASQSEQFNADRTAVDAARRLAQQGQEPASAVFAEVLDNPDLDDIELNDELYRELGLTEDEIEAQRMYSAYDVDPEGVDLGIGSVSMPGDGLGNLQEQKLGDDAYGPEAVLLAGFRAEEYAVVRATLDSAGGHVIKVLPVTERMLFESVDEAIWSPEVDWSAPRPQAWIQGGGWGSQRVLLCSGMPLRAQATVVELLEAGGLPAPAVSMVLAEDGGRRLGDVLAQAVMDHRKRSEASAARELWQVDGHSSGPTKSSRPSSSPSQSSTATATATSASAGTSSSNQAGSVPNGSARASAAGPFADGFGGGARGVGPMVGARMEEIQRELVRRGQERLKALDQQVSAATASQAAPAPSSSTSTSSTNASPAASSNTKANTTASSSKGSKSSKVLDSEAAIKALFDSLPDATHELEHGQEGKPSPGPFGASSSRSSDPDKAGSHKSGTSAFDGIFNEGMLQGGLDRMGQEDDNKEMGEAEREFRGAMFRAAQAARNNLAAELQALQQQEEEEEEQAKEQRRLAEEERKDFAEFEAREMAAARKSGMGAETEVDTEELSGAGMPEELQPSRAWGASLAGRAKFIQRYRAPAPASSSSSSSAGTCKAGSSASDIGNRADGAGNTTDAAGSPGMEVVEAQAVQKHDVVAVAAGAAASTVVHAESRPWSEAQAEEERAATESAKTTAESAARAASMQAAVSASSGQPSGQSAPVPGSVEATGLTAEQRLIQTAMDAVKPATSSRAKVLSAAARFAAESGRQQQQQHQSNGSSSSSSSKDRGPTHGVGKEAADEEALSSYTSSSSLQDLQDVLPSMDFNLDALFAEEEVSSHPVKRISPYAPVVPRSAPLPPPTAGVKHTTQAESSSSVPASAAANVTAAEESAPSSMPSGGLADVLPDLDLTLDDLFSTAEMPDQAVQSSLSASVQPAQMVGPMPAAAAGASPTGSPRGLYRQAPDEEDDSAAVQRAMQAIEQSVLEQAASARTSADYRPMDQPGSMLSMVRAALKAGKTPAEVQYMLTHQGLAASTSDAHEDTEGGGVTLPAPSAPADAARAPALEEQLVHGQAQGQIQREQQQQQEQQQVEAGPSPPPPAPMQMEFKGDPLLQVRPDILQAIQEKRVQFVDFSKLNPRQRTQVTEQMRKQRSSQAAASAAASAAGRRDPALHWPPPPRQEVQARMQAEAQARSQAGFGAESNGARSDNEDGDDNDDDDDDGGGLHEGEDGAESAVGQYDVDDAYADVDESAAEQDDEGSLQQDGHQDIEAEVEVEDGEEEEVPGPMALSMPQLSELLAAVDAQGLHRPRALAEALAMGVVIEPHVASALGVSLPSEDVIEQVRAELKEQMLAALQEQQQEEEEQETAGAADAIDTSAMGKSSSSQDGPTQPPPKRAWGQSLSRRRPTSFDGSHV